MSRLNSVASLGRRVLPNHWDVIAAAFIFAALTGFVRGFHGMNAPLPPLDAPSVSLDTWDLPYYALRTTLRMFAALFFSLIFTFTYATLAAKSRRLEMILIPVLDILQSVPILGFLTFTVTFFIGLFPGNVLGAECASIFAIFTSQAWNMAFSFYQSLRNVPRDLDEVARGFRFTGWQRFWQLEAPFAVPSLIWNTMMSMSGGWFFVVAAEAITVGDNATVNLPGIGSYIALANSRGDYMADVAAVVAMGVVILAYDQLLFRPVIAWAAKFRVELAAGQSVERSWVLDLLTRTHWVRAAFRPVFEIFRRLALLRIRSPIRFEPDQSRAVKDSGLIDGLWYAALFGLAAYALWKVYDNLHESLGWSDVREVLWLTSITLVRVTVMIVLASLIWVPISVWIGLRPRLAAAIQPAAQFLAAFPVNLIFGPAVALVLAFDLNPDIWLSFLMVFGTQWYIVFNTIGGAMAFPNDLREAIANFRIRGRDWWTKAILPGVAPAFFTGAIAASGGSWNAAIVAEVVKWKDQTVSAHGIGAYITQASDKNDLARVALGVAVMSIFVTFFNRLLWRKLYAYAERRLRL